MSEAFPGSRDIRKSKAEVYKVIFGKTADDPVFQAIKRDKKIKASGKLRLNSGFGSKSNWVSKDINGSYEFATENDPAVGAWKRSELGDRQFFRIYKAKLDNQDFIDLVRDAGFNTDLKATYGAFEGASALGNKMASDNFLGTLIKTHLYRKSEQPKFSRELIVNGDLKNPVQVYPKKGTSMSMEEFKKQKEHPWKTRTKNDGTAFRSVDEFHAQKKSERPSIAFPTSDFIDQSRPLLQWKNAVEVFSERTSPGEKQQAFEDVMKGYEPPSREEPLPEAGGK